MRLASPFNSSSAAARRPFTAVGLAFLTAVAALTFGGPIVAADEPEAVSQADSDSQTSERQRRREERQRARQSADAESSTSATVEGATATNGIEPEIVVVVEPQMECRRVVVIGSRVPKEICTPVVAQTATAQLQEEQAEEFLRRTRELQTRVPEDDGFLAPNAITGGF
jgi:hypothetical protein